MEVLLAVPFLAMGAAYLASQHFAVIGALASFCVQDIEPFLRRLSDPAEWAPQWDNSPALREYHKRAIAMRTIGHSTLILVPCMAALGANYTHTYKSDSPLGLVWWLGAAATGWSACVIRSTHVWRMGLYREGRWERPTDAQAD